MEITVVLAIVSVIMIATYQMIDESMRAAMFNESHNDLMLMSQAGVNAIHTEILQTRIAFQEDDLGDSYRSAFTPSIPAWTTSVLPVIDTTTTVIAPDGSGTRFTGNSLLLARQMPPLTVLYDHDDDDHTPEVEFVADRYRFEYIYLSPTYVKSFARSGMKLDLRMATSIEYADYFQLSTLPSGTGAIAQQLIDADLDRAWDPGKPIDAAFYELSGATDDVFDSPIRSPEIEEDTNRTLLKGLLGGRVTGAMEYSVAFGSYRLPQAQGMFAQPASPGGFEVKIVGPSGNRQVLSRILLMAHVRDRYESQQGFMTSAARF